MLNQAEVQLPQVRLHIEEPNNVLISIKVHERWVESLINDFKDICTISPNILALEKISNNTFGVRMLEKTYEILWRLINLEPPKITRDNRYESSKIQLVFEDFVTANSYKENFEQVGFEANLGYFTGRYTDYYIVGIPEAAYKLYDRYKVWFRDCGNLKNYIALEKFRKDFIEKHKEVFDETKSKKSDIRDLFLKIYRSTESSWEYKLEKMLSIANTFSRYPEELCPDLKSPDIKVFVEKMKALSQREICMNLEESEFKKQLLLENSPSTEETITMKRNAVIKIIDLPSPDNSKAAVNYQKTEETKEKKEKVPQEAFNSSENNCQRILEKYMDFYSAQSSEDVLAKPIMEIAVENISAIAKVKKIYQLIDESIKEKMKDGDISNSLMTRFYSELNGLLIENQPKQPDSSSILIDKSVFYVHELASNSSNVNGVSYFRQEKPPMKRKIDEMKQTDAPQLEPDMEVDTDDTQEEKKRRLNGNDHKYSCQRKSR